MNAYSLSPLFRQSIGFDRFNDLFETALKSNDEPSQYPPYNIEKHGQNEYRIVMAVAGFSDEDISITSHNNELTIAAKKAEKPQEEVVYLHRGIGTRAFVRKFSLADHVNVTGADFEHGLLKINLLYEVPEEAKPRQIDINNVK